MVDVGAAPIDRYVVLEHLSEGGMGAIYVGKKLGAGGFEMQVVLKQLLPEFTQQEEFIDLFLREAKLSATLDHANIVHTIDLVTAGGEYFIVMEYLPGGDLRTLLKKAKRRGKRFSPASAIHISREVLSALAYAHVKRDTEGVPLRLIHRDVSPSNILVSYAGEVKLTDFGIAKAATHNSLFYKVKGKIGYMSPEQARSETLDHRSDLYSLAVCMYEVLTGERLFVHAGLTTSAEEIYSQPVPQVSRKVPGLTPDLDAIMHKALALSPDARFQTAGEFQEALTRCAHRNGLLVSAPEVARELLDLCGPPDQWRGEDDDDDLGYVHRAATEVYEGGGEDDEDDDPFAPLHGNPSGAFPPVGTSGGFGPPSRHSSSRISRPRAELAKGGVVELTSIINMIDLENQHREAQRRAASQDAMNDSGARSFDSGPSAVQTMPIRQPLPGMSARSSQPRGSLPPPRPSQIAPAPVPPPPPGSPRRSAQMAAQIPAQMAMTMPQSPPPPPPPGSQRRSAHMPAQPVPPRSAPMRAQQPPPTDPYERRSREVQDDRREREALEVIPTQPLSLQRPPVSPSPAAPAAARARMRRSSASSRGDSQVRKRSILRPWLVIIAIILAAAATGVVIAMSGPDVAVQRGK